MMDVEIDNQREKDEKICVERSSSFEDEIKLLEEKRQRNSCSEEGDHTEAHRNNDESSNYHESNNYQESSNRSASVPDTKILIDEGVIEEGIRVDEENLQIDIILDPIVKSEEKFINNTSNDGESQVVLLDVNGVPLSKAAARMRKYRAEHRRDKSWLAKEAERMRKIRAARKAAEPAESADGKPKKYYAVRKSKTQSSTLLSEIGVEESLIAQSGMRI